MTFFIICLELKNLQNFLLLVHIRFLIWTTQILFGRLESALEAAEAAAMGTMEEEPEGPASLEQYSPIPYFMKYLPLIYKVDELWENFQLYIQSAFPDKEENFFAFQRSDEAMAIWAQAIADMGGGIPPSIFASAVFLILRYRELGHDLDRELAELT